MKKRSMLEKVMGVKFGGSLCITVADSSDGQPAIREEKYDIPEKYIEDLQRWLEERKIKAHKTSTTTRVVTPLPLSDLDLDSELDLSFNDEELL